MSTKPKKIPKEMPEPFMEGLIPTMNHRGFMSETTDSYSRKFANYAGSIDAEALDIGCAYGVATLAALENGARVVACDMDAGHIEVLEGRVPPHRRSQLRTSVGALPDVSFPAQAFGAILCSRVLHFMLGDEIRRSVQVMADWLRPGGKLFLVADTPYTGFWQSVAPEYERRKTAGEEWPGFIADVAPLLGGKLAKGFLPYLNPLDPDLLVRECQRAGLAIEKSGYTGHGADNDEGNQHAGAIAVKQT